ncbi:HTH-type transcriptional regulator PksA [Robertmurraya siralis]|uniref:HTH-type transcriptional regulator PksA n=1 Tax=Robertmurraya siralis TaxID=77777 RepID=A0A919WHH9_9BACI|nr:TetR/AcrR family transcriptional regulator [Robertmurraya siralis]PAE20021.1 TetR family transcriptional regulator [Bacillus sp. 7504-2]GIN62020.1 HTH-type transcriptional regulator PksA [Robertmurraya siralis]
MPKIVDHELRKKQIAEASWRVIQEQGMEGATVRNIAKEAGLSLGALRHYFSTQDELLEFAMNLVIERVTKRIKKIALKELPPKEKVLQILLEIVPTDTESMAEMEVWFSFIAYARYKKEGFDAQQDGIYDGIRNLILYLDQEKILRKNLNKEIEMERLYSLLDGTAMHALLEPKRLGKDKIYELFVYHLDSLCVDEV